MSKFPKQTKKVLLLLFTCVCTCLMLSSCASRIVETKDVGPKDKLVESKLTTSEVLGDLHVKVPESIQLDEVFELRLTTIGSWGTKPFFEDEDELQVEFVSAAGRLEPTKATLQSGIGSIQLTLSDLTLSDIDSTTKDVEITVLLKDLNQNLITKLITLNIQ